MCSESTVGGLLSGRIEPVSHDVENHHGVFASLDDSFIQQ